MIASPPLEPRLKRLMLFRVVMITTLLLIAIYAEAVSETLRPVNPLYYLIAATYALTILYALALRFAPHPEAQGYVQVVVDLLIITGLVYLTGGTGTRTGFMLLYPISVLSGSILLYRGKGLLFAGLATLFYAGLLLAVRSGAIPPQGLADVPFMLEKHLLYSIFVTGVACATVALIGSYLSESLRDVGEQLEEAAEQVADLRELNKVIVDSIHSGLITADAGGHILYVNNFGESILGVRTADIRERSLRDLIGSPLLEPLALQARASYEGLARFEVVYRRPDGTALDLGVSVSRSPPRSPRVATSSSSRTSPRSSGWSTRCASRRSSPPWARWRPSSRTRYETPSAPSADRPRC